MFKIKLSIIFTILAFSTNVFAGPEDYGNQAPAATQSTHNGKDCGPCEAASWNPDYAEQLLDSNSKKTDEAYVREIVAGGRKDGSNEIPGMNSDEEK